MASAESYSLLEKLVKEILKVRWVRDFLSKDFIDKNILEWCLASFEKDTPTSLSVFLVSTSENAIQKFTMWAPISHLEVEVAFLVGRARIAPMTAVLCSMNWKS
jgi:hypothetical protein